MRSVKIKELTSISSNLSNTKYFYCLDNTQQSPAVYRVPPPTYNEAINNSPTYDNTKPRSFF